MWIEIDNSRGKPVFWDVTPFAGVWIEIMPVPSPDAIPVVTPFAGVWIEMIMITGLFDLLIVTPFAGVWIEIRYVAKYDTEYSPSLPLRECGLKYILHARL